MLGVLAGGSAAIGIQHTTRPPSLELPAAGLPLRWSNTACPLFPPSWLDTCSAACRPVPVVPAMRRVHSPGLAACQRPNRSHSISQLPSLQDPPAGLLLRRSHGFWGSQQNVSSWTGSQHLPAAVAGGPSRQAATTVIQRRLQHVSDGTVADRLAQLDGRRWRRQGMPLGLRRQCRSSERGS